MKRIISIISVIALLCTIFTLPAMAEDTNVVANSYTTYKIVGANTNAATYGFTETAPSTHYVASSDIGIGTHVNSGTYFKKFEADSFAAPKPVTGIYAEASGGKFTLDITAYTSINKAIKALTYGANDRVHISAYLSNLKDEKVSFTLMPAAAGVAMHNAYAVKLPQNRWSKLDIIYDPNVTYTFTVDGTEYTASTVGKVLPSVRNTSDGVKFYASSALSEATVASNTWTAILGLADMTYDSTKTYLMKKVQFGKADYYLNGSLEYSVQNSQTYNEDSTNFHWADAVVSRVASNSSAIVSLSNHKYEKITNYDAATFDFGQPVISGVEGKYTVIGGNIYTNSTINKSDITVPDGAVMKVYENTAVSAADAYKYTEVTGDTIAIGDLVTIQKDADGGDRITYEVKKDSFNEYSYTGTELAASALGNVTVTYEGGVAGKAADDMALRMLPNATTTDPFVAMNYGISSSDLASYNGYIHISYNLLVDGAKSSTKIKLSSTGAYGVAGNTNDLVVTNLNQNQWNRVDVVLYLEGGKVKGTDNGVVNGTSKVYINGELKTSGSTFLGGYHKDGRFCNPLRVGFTVNADATQSESMYIDDYKTYCSYSEPVVPAMPEAITANVGDTVASVTAKGATVFVDTSYKAQPAEDAVLKNGNVILSVEDDTYVYYTVMEEGIKHFLIFGGSFESAVRFTPDWTTAGLGGKSADDVSLKLTKHAHETDGNYVNMYPQLVYNRADDAKKYVVIALNLYIPSEAKFKDFGIYSQQHSNLGETIGNDRITRDKWHSIVDVIEYTDEGAKCTLYLDGNKYGNGDRIIGTKKTTAGEVQQFGGSIFNQIRFAVVTGEITDTSTVYMDDIVVYETDEAFVPSSLTLPDDYGLKYELVEGDRLYIKDNAQFTVAEVKEKIPNAIVIRASEELADDAVVAKGDVIRYREVENYCKDLSGYRAIVVCGDIFGNDNFKMYKADGTTTVAPGDNVRVRIADGGILVAAGYGADGTMSAVASDFASTTGYTAVKVPDADKVSFIALSDLGSLKPACGKYEITFPAAE